jgi:transposase InsO family protein
MRSDSGGEFVSKEFYAFFYSCGILRDFSVPRRPQQNVSAETVNGVLVERAIAVLMECDLGTILWPKAILHACYLRNRSPSLRSSTHFEAFFGEKPDVSNLRVLAVLLMFFVISAQGLRVKWTKVDLLVSLRVSKAIVSLFQMGHLLTVGMLLLIKV